MLPENFEMFLTFIRKKTLSVFFYYSVLSPSRYDIEVIRNRLVLDNLNYIRGASSKRNVTKS